MKAILDVDFGFEVSCALGVCVVFVVDCRSNLKICDRFSVELSVSSLLHSDLQISVRDGLSAYLSQSADIAFQILRRRLHRVCLSGL